MRGKIICWLILIFISATTATRAEPDKVIQYLINEPVSLLDWGLRRMADMYESNLKLDYLAQYLKGRFTMSSVEYDYAHNKIHVEVWLLPAENSGDEEDHKQRSKQILNFMKAAQKQFIPDYLFQHNGYQSPKRPQNVGKHIVGLIEYDVSSEFKGKIFTFKTSMNSDEVFFSERKKEAQ